VPRWPAGAKRTCSRPANCTPRASRLRASILSEPAQLLMVLFSKSRWNGPRESMVDCTSEPHTVDHSPVMTSSKTREATVSRIPSWPEDAKPLKKHNWLTWLYLVGDIVLALLPVYFIRKSAKHLLTVNGISNLNHFSKACVWFIQS
jgi:hypothetical protein